ncbi:MAG: MOSC domain-containing protein [Porticoccaceae bacterium]|nr:MOSC domain-containing protein [Porticoccaceae bacterium]MDG1311378.1 MOSC domain-containing protein [Porticoccaceae bacterium]
MSEGKIKGIYIAAKAGDGISGHEKVLIRAGKGIVGDRYYSETGKNRSNYKGQPDWEITLIESEVVENFNSATGNTFHESDFRRNVVTEGIRLNDLVGKTFRVNGLECYGVQLCEPCASLQKRLAYKILPDLVGKGGLRAQIRGAGIIAVGDSIES